jgi:hypothetical protein
MNKKSKKNIGDAVDMEKMSLYQLCRWSALEEAVNIIGDKCEDKGIPFESIELKPLDLMKYIDNATDKIYEKVSAVVDISSTSSNISHT